MSGGSNFPLGAKEWDIKYSNKIKEKNTYWLKEGRGKKSKATKEIN